MPRLCPAGLCRFLQGVHQLTNSLDLCCGFGRVLTHFDNVFNLLAGETHYLKFTLVSFRINAAELFQGIQKDILAKPTFTETFAETTFINKFLNGLLDFFLCRFPVLADFCYGLFNSDTHRGRGGNKCILEHLAAHACVDNRVPVLCLDDTGGHSLR